MIVDRLINATLVTIIIMIIVNNYVKYTPDMNTIANAMHNISGYDYCGLPAHFIFVCFFPVPFRTKWKMQNVYDDKLV